MPNNINQQHNLKKRVRFEELLTDISARFVNLPASRVDTAIEESQRQICEYLDLDLSALWQWDDETNKKISMTHFFSGPGAPENPVGLDAAKSFPHALKKSLKGKVFVLSTKDLPSEAARDRETRNHYGVKSSVIIPLFTGDGVHLGILSFSTVKREKTFADDIVKRLELVAQVFINALERKRFEKALTSSEERLRLATESALAGIWELNCSEQTIWATKLTKIIFDYPEEKTFNMEAFEASVHPDDLPNVRQAIDKAMQENTAININYRIKSRDGSQKWVVSRGRTFFKSTGEPDRILGVSIDITELKKMEEKLRNQVEEIKFLHKRLEKENIYLKNQIAHTNVCKKIVGQSPSIRSVLNEVEKVAFIDSTVLVEGDTGTGKELIAHAIHQLSLRKAKPLFIVNCASLPPTLVESELFGREKGAYTGAMTNMIGRFEVANGATLFLDEISELPLEIQAKLLRVIEQGSFERIGSSRTISTDVRIIAASNQRLQYLVNAGKFRKDLYYRLNVFPIKLPPLMERPDDIPALVWAFVKQFEAKMGKRIDHISQSCLDRLQEYSWPGNVRELKNAVERAMIVCNGRTLNIEVPIQHPSASVPTPVTLLDSERNHIIDTLKKTGWRISGKGGAAEVLGLKRTTLQSKMKKLGINRP